MMTTGPSQVRIEKGSKEVVDRYSWWGERRLPKRPRQQRRRLQQRQRLLQLPPIELDDHPIV